MKLHFLSNSIATVCGRLEGLQLVQLPGGLDNGYSEDLVTAANADLVNPPFAILVGSGDDTSSDPHLPRVSGRNAIRYRRGNRLAVVAGAGVDLASFDNSYRKVVGPGFPHQSSDLLSLADIAGPILDDLLARLQVVVDASVFQECSEELFLALSVLAKCYEFATDTTRGWNGLWFDHVERGLESLARALHDVAADQQKSEPFGLAFTRLLWPSLGLPQASGEKPWSADRAPQQFMEALAEFWGDRPSIDLSLAQLREVLPGMSWDELEWDDFEEARLRRESLLGALQDVVSRPDGVTIWAQMDRSRFESPFASKQVLSVLDEDGKSLSVAGQSDPALVSAYEVGAGFETDTIVLAASTLGTLTDAELGDLSIGTSLKTAEFAVSKRWNAEGKVLLAGKLKMKSRSSLKPLRVRLLLEVDPASPTAGRVAAKPEAALFVALTSYGALAWPKNERLGKAVYAGPENSHDQAEGGDFESDLTMASEHLVVFWGPDLDGDHEEDGAAATPFRSTRVPEGADFQKDFDTGAAIFRGTSGAAGFLTPLTAAVTKSFVDEGPMAQSVTASVRGLMEQQLRATEVPKLLPVLGHVVVPDDTTITNTIFTADASLGVGGVAEYLPQWAAQTGQGVSHAVSEGFEADGLRKSLLAVLETVPSRDRGRWPSRTSWKHLHGTEALNNYLGAYASLVESCSGADPITRFWACFPFSVSVWHGKTCQAVLLSPLHPVRLAWLAATEATLFDADLASRLAGTVEGWQFPGIGPAPTPQGRMLAIPSDSGQGQVFAAWSMMIPVSSNENERLRPPARALGKPAPGTSPSGLTASAAEAALRDFLRANAHIPSLTVDLAASADTARLQEVDEAVIATIKGWTKAKNGWGVRVLDSVHRTGDIPRGELAKLTSEAQNSRTVSWSRYRPSDPDLSKPDGPLSNIRLLQDSGAELRTRSVESSHPQVIGPVPLRRFSVGDVVHGKEAYRAVRLAPGGWNAFDDALRAVEGSPSPTELGIRLSQSYLLDRSADWTVSGEAFLSPAAVSALVAAPLSSGASRGDRVLWEWKPPYLQGKHGGAIDRRPYVTVARVSPALRENLARKISEVTTWTGSALEKAVGDVLIRLGTEGLGLSSLLTRGGTHESGALGFYLAYGLLGYCTEQDCTEVVLPLDACDPFLTALGGARPSTPSKRADLLFMRFKGSDVTLVPVEIKFYGADSISGSHLPKPGAAMKEALGQLRETSDTLRRLVDRSNDVVGADRILWYSAFATLVESGLHLRGGQDSREANAQLLGRLVAGQTKLHLGQPVVMYFSHEPGADDAFEVYEDQLFGSQTYGAIAARPHTVFDAFTPGSDTTGGIAQAVSELVSWAASTGLGTGLPAEGPKEPQGEHGQTKSTPDAPEVATPAPPKVTTPAPEGSGGRVSSDESGDLDEEPEAQDAAEAELESPNELFGDGIRFPVGRFVGALGKPEAEFWPSNTRLNQLNVGIAGDLGTGKTQLLQTLILFLRREAARVQPTPLSFLILDYKEDFQDSKFLDAVGGVVLEPHNIPLNPFQLDGPYSKLRAYERAKDFCDVLERIYSGVGPVQRQRLTTAVTDSFADHPETAPTLSEVLERYQEDVTADSVTSILRDFVMREIFAEEPNSTVLFDDLLEDRVVVLAVDKLGTDKEGKNALIALFLNHYYGYMLRRTKWPVQGSEPSLRRLNSYLLVDEAVNIMRYDFEVLENLLLQGREFGVGVMLSSQYLSHFRTSRTNWAEPLLTWFIHKVPGVTLKDLEKLGLPAAPAVVEQLGNLENHEAIYWSLDTQGRRIRGYPFFEQ